MRPADLVIADTDAHADFFAKLAGIPRNRIVVCFLGAEEPPLAPGWKPIEVFGCLFYGKMIPLHGLDTILAAARLAPEIPFRIAGAGQLEALLERDLSAQRRLDSLGGARANPARDPVERGVRSGSSAPPTRRQE